ncbi:MAG: carboxymuconolactone decarboxylase family protein [Casimicrobiaceae bacterium]
MNSGPNKSTAFEDGLAVRRKVLGTDHVDASLKGADEFTWPIQQLVTEYCWGAVWTRPGLGLRERSLINLAMITALNRPHELKVHVRGALNNGVTKEEIMEVLLQAGIYCGAPAALDSFRVAREVLTERGIALAPAGPGAGTPEQ